MWVPVSGSCSSWEFGDRSSEPPASRARVNSSNPPPRVPFSLAGKDPKGSQNLDKLKAYCQKMGLMGELVVPPLSGEWRVPFPAFAPETLSWVSDPKDTWEPQRRRKRAAGEWEQQEIVAKGIVSPTGGQGSRCREPPGPQQSPPWLRRSCCPPAF